MTLPFISRADQNSKFGVMQFRDELSTSDRIFDGEQVQKNTVAMNWKRESDVHRTVLLSSTVRSTRNLLGQQENLIRDDLRLKSWAAYIEDNDRLVLAEISKGRINKKTLLEEGAWRSHIALDKYTGHVHVVATCRNEGHSTLVFDGAALETVCEQPDFPFFSVQQVPIGHVPVQPSEYGLLTYKCRTTGICYARPFANGKFETEYMLHTPKSVGGISFAISGDNVVALLYRVDGNRAVPTMGQSSDRGRSFSEFDDIQLPYSEEFEAVPFTDGPTQDHHGFIHIPLGVTNGKLSKSLNLVVDEAIVEAIVHSGDLRKAGHAGLKRFPKSSPCDVMLLYLEPSDPQVQAMRYGDGQTDGVGLISTLLVRGMLHTSNSQSSGISFPQKAHLNHEMPMISAFRASECYTRGVTANTVSMDYLYLESTTDGRPLGGELHFEIWDMPLPLPNVSARAEGQKIVVQIEKDANFRPGETVFKIDNPTIEILEVTFQDVRHAILTTTSDKLGGAIISFEVRSTFLSSCGNSGRPVGSRSHRQVDGTARSST